MKHLKAVCVAAVAVTLVAVLAGCSSTVRNAPGSGIDGLKAENLKCSGEMVILDTVEAKGELTKILGMPWPWFFGDQQYGYVSTGSISSFFVSRDAVAVATYNALSKVPEADTILPLTTTCSSNGFGMFYQHETATVKGKAVKVKGSK